MSKLKQKKYIASILIMVIVLGIIGLFSYGKVDKYKGQIKVGKAKLLGSVVDTGLVTSKGTEEVKYNLTYTLDPVEGLETRDVVIKGKLNSPYARFKEINKSNITSTLINDGQEIEINIEDVRLGEQKELELIIKVLNAPNKEEITPEISIKEKTGEYTNVTGNPIKVETNSIEGIVLDENNLPVSNIELSINKNGREIKRTYTSVEGNYVFSDLEEGEYIIKVEEDIYEIESGEKVTPGEENNKIKVKQVDKYNVETKKNIEKLDLVVNGKENHYTYKDSEKVIQNVKNAKRISGKIEYKIVVRNKSEKQVEIDELEDTPGEGLEFKESENDGWKNKNGKIVYELMEGVSLRGKEKREIKLVLSINDTNEIKTYINKMTSRGEIKEKVVFVIDGKTKREIEVTEGTVIERPDFDIEELDGWYTDSNYTNKYKFTNRVNKDLILYARTNEEKPKYTVRYIDKNEVIKTEEIEEGERTTAPSDPSKRGYTFNCWKNKNSCFDFDTPIEEDIDLISDYNIITYNVTYNLQGGTVTGNPGSYTVETNPFTLVNPTKEGYTFIGWTGSNGDTPELTVTLPEDELGDKNYTANYSINRYELEIDPKGGEYSGDLLLEEDYGSIITISEPTKEGYTFTGWTLTGKGTFNNGIYTFEDGNGKLEANYEVINYDIVYKEITDAERTQLNNPTSYNIETNEFTLNNPANRLNEDNEGKVFVGWKEKNSDTPSMNITLPDRNDLGNKEYTAIWQERQPDKWNITYILNGGTVSGNPTEYKRSQLPITLNNPTKDGYRFIGWTGSNGDTPGNVTIARGTEGDLNYTANYEVNNYTISYDYTSCNLTSEEITALNNRGSYTIEDNNFNLNNPNKYGYVFEGWTGTDLETKTINVTVDTSKIKNLSYKANCVLDKYDVEFYNMKSNGEYELSTTVSDIEYNSSIPSNKIPTVSLRGYTFKYWSLDKTNEFNFNTPITENTKLYAVYQKDTYNITYELDGGTVSGNPDTYSVDTPEFTLNEPSKTGYEFTGWTGSCGDSPLKVVTLPEEELGPKNYVANYKINKYTVTYMNGESKVDDEEVEYNKKATGNVETPTKAHNIFKRWTLNNELYDFDTPVTSNITLYASWEEVEAPTITHSPTTWVGDKVLVTIGNKGTTGKDYTGYTYKYKIGSGSYQDYNGPFEVTENTTVYAYSVKDEINSIEESHEINNIDKINPKINEKSVSSLAPTSVTLNIKGQDLESGLAYIKVYLGSDEVFSTEEYPGNDNDEKEVEVTIGNLEQITTYTIKAEILDKVGNISSEEIEVTTPEKHYVARTLDEDGVEIRKYETLKEAIESSECISICRIEMLDNVEETNSVLDGQDIKLDLNGYTITGLQDKAFENNGILQIVDYNEEEVGKVYSSGTAIINTGKLIIGENEEPLEVSKVEPVIEGLVTGINSPGELHFYDGKIIGGSTTGALKGSAPITPYSYNASVETSGDKEIATLEIIADAEARINSVYYTKVQEAVDASKNGSYEDVDYTRPIIKQIRNDSEYRFIYDESLGQLINNNQGKDNTVAHSYIKLDLTNYESDQLLIVNASIISQSGYDYGYVTVTDSEEIPAYNQTDGRMIYISGTVEEREYTKLLKKGKVYYLHIGYRKDGSTSTGKDTFSIKNINLGSYVVSSLNDLDNAKVISESTYYFKKQEDGSYISTNKNISNSTANSYFVLDLTNIDEEKYILIDASISSQTNNDFGYITITDNSTVPSYNQTAGRRLYISGEQERATYALKLIPNQLNFIHLGYYKNANTNTGNDQFIIYSMKSSEENIDSITDGTMHNNGDYYFEKKDYNPFVWKDLSGKNKDGIIYGATLNDTEDGFIFDGDDYVEIPSGVSSSSLSTESIELEFSSTTNQSQMLYFGSTNEPIMVTTYNDKIIVTKSRNYTYQMPSNMFDGNKHKIIVSYSNGNYDTYFDGTKLNKLSNMDYWSNQDGNSYIGRRNNGYYYKGVFYSLKVYNRAISEEEIEDTISSEGLLIDLDASNYKTNLNSYFSNNKGVSNSTANSYMVFDLSNVAIDKNLIINASISSQNNADFGYITVTDTPEAPAYNVTIGRYVYVSNNSTSDYQIKLSKGKKNYVHFGYRKDGSTNSGYDSFIINNIRYYDKSETNTIPTYIIGDETYSNTDTFSSPIVNTNADNVQIIRNITLTNPLEIVDTRNVVLDLNGYTLTTASADYVVKNQGELKIIDSDYTGKIDAAIDDYNREQAIYNVEYEEELGSYNSFVQDLIDKKHNEKDVVVNFDYTGDVQEFTAPFTGEYTLETWGAQGGTAIYDTTLNEGGYGAYSTGKITLNQGDTIYIYVGGQGGGTTVDETSGTADSNTGYNGGGFGGAQVNNSAHSGGGGATHISTKQGLLKNLSNDINDILIVSAGGGGASTHKSSPNYSGHGGHGGGIEGSIGSIDTACFSYGLGGTQTAAGGHYNCPGSNNSYGNHSNVNFTGDSGFGFGSNYDEAIINTTNVMRTEVAGGGSGFYGGGSAWHSTGGGGSSYIGNSNLTDKHMTCYDCMTSDEIGTKTISNTNVSDLPQSDFSKKGNGYARISYVDPVKENYDVTDAERELDTYSKSYSYTGSYQTFEAPITANYKVEAWGGSGSFDAYGAYTKGNIELQEGEKIYIYVGNKANTSKNTTTFNGGTSSSGGYNGGSSTDIRLVSGNWNDTASLASRIMVAAGGGSGSSSTNKAGAAGGLEGYNGIGSPGGTQTNFGSSTYTSSSFGIANGGCSGGNGYYPGGGADCASGAGGGSSFISGHTGSVAITSESDISPKTGCVSGTLDTECSYHYSNKIFTKTKMIDGKGYQWTNIKGNNIVGMPTITGDSITTGNSGAGAVKISIAKPELQQAKLNTDIDQTGTIISTTSSVILNDYNALLDIDGGIISLNKSGSLDVITNRGTLTLGEYGHVNGLQSNNRGINNTISGDIIDGTGTITMSSSNNIGILNDGVNEDNIKGYNLVNTSSNSYNIYNSSINDLLLDNINSKGSGVDIYQNTDNDLIVKDSNLGSSSNESYYSNETSKNSNVTFDNCEIGNRIYNRSNSARTILIKNSNMTGNRGNVYNYGGKITVKDSTLNNSTWNIINYSKTDVLDCELKSSDKNITNSDYENGVYADLYVKNSLLTANDTNIRNPHGTSTIEDSILNTNNNSVYNGLVYVHYGTRYSSGNTNLINNTINKKGGSSSNVVYNSVGSLIIDGGIINNENNNSTAVYNDNVSDNNVVIKGDYSNSENFVRGVYNTQILTIGDSENDVSKTYPSINATNSAIYNSDTAVFNYYDGKLVGIKDNGIDGPISDIAIYHDINVTKGDDLETIVLKTKEELEEMGEYVARIGSINYSTLQDAFDAIPNDNTETEVVLLKNIETENETIIEANKNVKINYDGYTIKIYNKNEFLTNNGNLTLIDENEIVNNKSYSEYLIINNGTLNYNSIYSMPIRTQKIINNNKNAIFNMSGGEIYSYQTGLIENSGIMNMVGGKIYTTRTDWRNSISSILITNNETGEITLDGGEISFVGKGTTIDNKNRLIINNTKVDLYGHYISGDAYSTYYEFTTFINNSTPESYAKVLGGTYGTTGNKGLFIRNIGTAEIENVISNFKGSMINSGTITATNTKMENLGFDLYYRHGTTSYIGNSGTMTLTGGRYVGGATNAFINNSGTLTIDGTYLEHNLGYWYSANGNMLYATGNSNISIKDSTLKECADHGVNTIYAMNNSIIDIKESTIINTKAANDARGILQENTSKIVLTNVDITTKQGDSINKSSSSTLDISGGNIINQTGNYAITNSGAGVININANSAMATNGKAAINNSGSGTLVIGELGGVPSKTQPEITGKTYGLYNSNENAIINFYDGIISGQTAIFGKINETEPGYDIILETDDIEHKYLDKQPIIKNITKEASDPGNKYEYYSIQDAIDDANDNDELELMREYTVLPNIPLVINIKNLSLDLKGYKLYQNNTNLIQNDGILTIKSSVDGGKIETNTNNIFINNGTLNIESGTYDTTSTNPILTNNENAIFNMLGGELYSYQTGLIDNSGVMNMVDGKIYTTRTDWKNSSSNTLITNNETGEIILDGGEISFVGKGTTIDNKNRLIINNTKVDLYGHYISGDAYSTYYEFTTFINNSTPESYAKVLGGTYGTTGNKGLFIRNIGTAEIENVISNFKGSMINSGTITATNTKMENLGFDLYYRHGTTSYIGNSGTMTLTGGRYVGGATNAFINNSGTLTIDGTYLEHNLGYWYSANGNMLYATGNSNISIKDSTLKECADHGVNTIYAMNNSTIDIKGSTIINTKAANDARGILQENASRISLEETTINVTQAEAIYKSSSGTLDIISGNINTGNSIGIYNSGSGSVTIGDIGGLVSTNNPTITGKTYGLYNSNTTADVNFYDGIITGATAIYGSITDVEPSYEIIQKDNGDETYSKYLDQIPLVKNTRTNREYNSISDAIDDSEFNNGDTLEFLRDLTTLPSYTTIIIPNNVEVIIDMKGNKISQNHEKLFINNGILNITDSSDSFGSIQMFKNNVIENNGTLLLEKIRIYSESNGNKLLINNDNSSATLNNVEMSTREKQIIDNYGTLTISGGSYRKTNSAGTGERYTDSLLNNDVNGVLNISNATFENKGDGSATIYNKNMLTVIGGSFLEKGGGGSYNGPSYSFYNTADGVLTVDGTSFSDTDKYGRLIMNYGNATIDNSNVNMRYAFNAYSGTLSFNNTNMPFDHNYYGNSYLYNSSVVNITGGNYACVYDYFVYPMNSSTLNITNINYTTDKYGLFRAEDDATVNVTGGTYTNTKSYTEDTGIFQFMENSKGTITNATTSATYSYALYAYGDTNVLVQGGNISSDISSIVVSGNNVTNIISGTIKSNTANAVYVSGNSTINIGEKGGVPSITSPSLYGKSYGLYHATNTSNFNFYDGIIKGETGSIYGTITNTEDGYKEKRDNVTDPDSGVATIDSTLTVVGDTERIAMVGTVNFLSLQSAVNYASNNNIPDIQMFKSVTLDSDLVKPAGGANVVIHLNGTTITQGSYTIDPGITLDSGTAPGASVARFLANIAGEEINPRNIVIYELEDGSKLEANNTYKLYKEIGGELKIVKVRENEIGDYDLGYDKEILRTTRSRIYINGIGEGTYKLVGSDSKEITFTIYHDGVSSNIRENNNINGNRVSTAIATLILSLQTGMVRNPYILIMMILIVGILGFIALKKNQEYKVIEEDYQE